MDKGSNTLHITTKLANVLFLKGKVKLTTVLKACDWAAQSESQIHHKVVLQDQHWVKHKVRCIKVPFITETQLQPSLNKVYKIFPSIPCSCLQCPNMEIGLLLGQNANILLPTGGTGEHRVNNLRIRRTLLGETGYVLEGHHPNIWGSDKKARIQLLWKVTKVDASLSEALFPDLSDMPLEIPRSCPNCKDCRQCQYKVCNMTYCEKKKIRSLEKIHQFGSAEWRDSRILPRNKSWTGIKK